MKKKENFNLILWYQHSGQENKMLSYSEILLNLEQFS